jgi:DNA-binding MarR family transcriptional regulator
MAEDKREKALDLTEKGLEKLDQGEKEEGERLIDEAVKTDPGAVEDVLRDIDQATKK